MNQIRWTQGDYVKLGIAVKKFNTTLDNLPNNNYLPEGYNYKELKKGIKTRSELNRMVNNLKKFDEQSATLKVVKSKGAYGNITKTVLTQWEFDLIKSEKSRITRGLNRELAELKEPKEQFGGLNYYQMGIRRVREIEGEIKRLNDLFNRSGYEYSLLKQHIHLKGTSDVIMKKSINFMNQFMDVIKKYEHLDNYEILEEYMKKIKNPFQFYKRAKEIQKVDENVGDLNYQYVESYMQAEFNRFVSIWTGISENELNDTEGSFEE